MSGGRKAVSIKEVVALAQESGLVVLGAPRDVERWPAPIPTDWPKLLADGIPPIKRLWDPYIYEGTRVWVSGPAESGKSLWAMWLGARLSQGGRAVAFFSQENPLDVDVQRLAKLEPDAELFTLYHDAGIDLANPECVAWIINAHRGHALVVFDTLSATWTGDENINAEIAALDREALAPIARETGAAVVVLDHTGHPQPFVGQSRQGHASPRGASSKGQKADTVLEFRQLQDGGQGFVLIHGKNRPGGGRKEPPRRFDFIDTEDDRIELQDAGTALAERVLECAEVMVEAACKNPEQAPFSSGWLRKAATAAGVTRPQTHTDALHLLAEENPPRLAVRRRAGPRGADQWWLAGDEPEELAG